MDRCRLGAEFWLWFKRPSLQRGLVLRRNNLFNSLLGSCSVNARLWMVSSWRKT